MSALDVEKYMRSGTINQTNQIWRMSENKVTTLVEQLSQNLTEPDAKDRLLESFQVFRKVIDSLLYDKGYRQEEDPHYFKELIENLQDAFKYFYESYAIECHDNFVSDAIDFMNRVFYESMACKRGLPPDEPILQAYPGITLQIRLLRNCQKHEYKPPVDHITQKKSFGNLYTISSIVVLSIYAYSEISKLGVIQYNWLPPRKMPRLWGIEEVE